MKTLYKASVYLAQTINAGKVEGIPFFHTASSEDKDFILNYVKALHSQGIVQAYRILFSPNCDENSWYQDSEVIYLDGSCPIIRGIFSEKE